MRKAAVSPSFSLYLEHLAQDQPLDLVLRSHLVIEALLVELIQLRKSGDTSWKWNFRDKTKFCVDEGFLPATREAMYLKLNDIRNDFGHILGHRMTFNDAFTYVEEMFSLGYEFSDDTIHQDRKLSEEWYGIEGILMEIVGNLYQELSGVLLQNGGPDRTG